MDLLRHVLHDAEGPCLLLQQLVEPVLLLLDEERLLTEAVLDAQLLGFVLQVQHVQVHRVLNHLYVLVPLIEILGDDIDHTAVEGSTVVFASFGPGCIIVKQLPLSIHLDVYVLLLLGALVVHAGLLGALAFGHCVFLVSSEESLVQTKIVLFTVLICSGCVSIVSLALHVLLKPVVVDALLGFRRLQLY